MAKSSFAAIIGRLDFEDEEVVDGFESLTVRFQSFHRALPYKQKPARESRNSPFACIDSLTNSKVKTPLENVEPPLNVGIQYLKSIIYGDDTIEGSEILREKFRQERQLHEEMLRDEQEQREREIELGNQQLMEEQDMISQQHEQYCLMQLNLEKKNKLLEKKKFRNKHIRDYLAWKGKQKVQKCDSKVKRIDWECMLCHFRNKNLVLKCEKCGEHSPLQDPIFGTWELMQIGTYGVFSPGFYVVEAKSGKRFVLEQPPRWWSTVELTSSINEDKITFQLTIAETTVEGTIMNDKKTIQWCNGAKWEKRSKIIKVVKNPSIVFRKYSILKPPTAARETPRAVSKQVCLIKSSCDIDNITAISVSMDKNKSLSVQHMGCLALGKIITAGNDYIFHQSLILSVVISAFELHRSSKMVASSAISTLYWMAYDLKQKGCLDELQKLLICEDPVISMMRIHKNDRHILRIASDFLRIIKSSCVL